MGLYIGIVFDAGGRVLEAQALEFRVDISADMWMCTLTQATPGAERYEIWFKGSRIFPEPQRNAIENAGKLQNAR